ncbi:hypothetical protein ABW20_dc0101860 [Dactylellina cionopaga]|nr:hypothetical protein ABW20_dc0101860 [Dactylellina cionopaga]
MPTTNFLQITDDTNNKEDGIIENVDIDDKTYPTTENGPPFTQDTNGSDENDNPAAFKYFTYESWNRLLIKGHSWRSRVAQAFHNNEQDQPLVQFFRTSNYILSGHAMTRSEGNAKAWRSLKSLWEGPKGANQLMRNDYTRITIDNIDHQRHLYTHYISVSDRTLIICEAYKVPDRGTPKARWSDILFTAWSTQARLFLNLPSAVSELRYIGIYSIDNATTGAIIRESFSMLGLNKQKDTLVVERTDDGVKGAVYDVLMMAPIFKGVLRMLVQHASLLGYRVVSQLQIRYASRNMSQLRMYPNVLMSLEQLDLLS